MTTTACSASARFSVHLPPPARLEPPATVLEIADRLERAGFETWCVGGAVRDALLGQAHLDWDLATAATPDEIRRVFGRRHTVPVGIEHGTVGVLDRHGGLHEVTTFRRDVRTDGRHAVVEFGASLDDDLARRDFTINAIAYHPRQRTLRDPYGGRSDLERRVVRAVGDPQARMREDRLRALRALRFAGRLGFRIDPATWSAVVASAPHLRRLSAERVKQELEKTMEQLPRPSAALSLWIESGSMGVLVPPLSQLGTTTLRAIDCVPVPPEGLSPRRRARKIVRFAVLFSGLGAADVRAALTALRFSKSEVAAVEAVVDRWRAAGPSIERALLGGESIHDATIRRWVADIGRLEVPLVMRVAAALWAARGATGERVPVTGAARALYRRLLRSRFRDPVELSDLAIDGDDLRAAGIPPGRELGKILQALLDRVIRDPSLNTPGWLVEEAKRLYDEGNRGGSTDTPPGR
jgi:tRNA nucleotidyltransferase (CCA-adding enzyme)